MFKVSAIYDLVDQPVGQLNLTANETLEVIEESDSESEWYLAKNDRNEEGYVPKTFVQKIFSAGASPAAESSSSAPPIRNIEDKFVFDDPSVLRSNSSDSKPISASNVLCPDIKVFLEGKLQLKSNNMDAFTIMWSDGHPRWKEAPCGIESAHLNNPKKQRKSWLKPNFIEYDVITKTTDQKTIQVERRFKQFEWLDKMLRKRFPLFCIPALPEKKFIGNAESDFIRRRQDMIERWLNAVLSHTALKNSSLIQWFLTCADEGKRKRLKHEIRNEEVIGEHFFLTLSISGRPELEASTETINHFAKVDLNFRCAVHQIEQEIPKFFGSKTALSSYGSALNKQADAENLIKGSATRTEGFRKAGNAFCAINHMFHKELPESLRSLEYYCKEISSMSENITSIADLHNRCEHSCRKSSNSNDSEMIRKQADIVSSGILAEIEDYNHKRQERTAHEMKNMLKTQISSYKNIITELENALAVFMKI